MVHAGQVDLELYLIDENANEILWGRYSTIERCRLEWREIAKRSGTTLEGFWVRDANASPMVVYQGNYVTDEC